MNRKRKEGGSSDATYHRINFFLNEYLTVSGFLKLWNVGMDKRLSPVLLLIASISEGNQLHSKSTLLWMIHRLFFFRNFMKKQEIYEDLSTVLFFIF